MNKDVKPFGVSAEVDFRRVDIIANLMEFFPPPHSCKGSASQAHWKNFNKVKTLSETLKYNLFPEFFLDRFEDMEEELD